MGNPGNVGGYFSEINAECAAGRHYIVPITMGLACMFCSYKTPQHRMVGVTPDKSGIIAIEEENNEA